MIQLPEVKYNRCKVCGYDANVGLLCYAGQAKWDGRLCGDCVNNVIKEVLR